MKFIGRLLVIIGAIGMVVCLCKIIHIQNQIHALEKDARKAGKA